MRGVGWGGGGGAPFAALGLYWITRVRVGWAGGGPVLLGNACQRGPVHRAAALRVYIFDRRHVLCPVNFNAWRYEVKTPFPPNLTIRREIAPTPPCRTPSSRRIRLLGASDFPRPFLTRAAKFRPPPRQAQAGRHFRPRRRSPRASYAPAQGPSPQTQRNSNHFAALAALMLCDVI